VLSERDAQNFARQFRLESNDLFVDTDSQRQTVSKGGESLLEFFQQRARSLDRIRGRCWRSHSEKWLGTVNKER
jgi:hypothetical protein